MQNLTEKMDFLSGPIHAKQQWLLDHGPGTKRPWPDIDIEAKRYHLRMLEAIYGDYQASQQRRASA